MRYLVLGAGVSGKAASHLLRGLGHEVAIFDDRPAALTEFRDEGFATHGGEWSDGLLSGVDEVITSPGFAVHSEPVRGALEAGVRVISELELGFRHLAARVIAVTGTNGKSTTTRLLADMLAASGVNATAAGNIGVAISDLAAGAEPAGIVVVEASSFQLRFIDTFAPDVAVIVNIAPDHLDWHGSVEAYVAAKARITENMAPHRALVYDASDPGAVAVAAEASVRRLGVGPGAEAGGFADGVVRVGDDQIDAGDVDSIIGIDMAVAAVASRQAGATPDGIAAAIDGFRPDPHRRSVVISSDGVTWVDDSKATNPHAAVRSAASYPSVILIAGGRNKGLDLSPLAAVGSVRHIVAVGEATPELVAAGGELVTPAGSMEQAVEAAAAMAVAGDTVLLAPGCASFDQFDSYAERGDAFAQAVLARSG